MDCLRPIIARLCGQLPGKSGLAGYVVCCVLPCRALQGWLKPEADDRTEKNAPVARHVGERRVLIFGLDGSGKTSFLWMCEHPLAEELAPDETRAPTSGVLRLTRKDVKCDDAGPGVNEERAAKMVDLDMCEIGGDARIRPFWSRYISRDIKVLAFFVDASAPQRLQDAALQFTNIAKAALEMAPRIRLLLIASRIDVHGAISAAEVHARVRAQVAATSPGLRYDCAVLGMRGTDGRASQEALLRKLAKTAL